MLCNEQFWPQIQFVPEAGLALSAPWLVCPQCQHHTQFGTEFSTVPEFTLLYFSVPVPMTLSNESFAQSRGHCSGKPQASMEPCFSTAEVSKQRGKNHNEKVPIANFC